MVSQNKDRNDFKPQNKYFHPLYHSQAIIPDNQHLVPKIRKSINANITCKLF